MTAHSTQQQQQQQQRRYKVLKEGTGVRVKSAWIRPDIDDAVNVQRIIKNIPLIGRFPLQTWRTTSYIIHLSDHRSISPPGLAYNLSYHPPVRSSLDSPFLQAWRITRHIHHQSDHRSILLSSRPGVQPLPPTLQADVTCYCHYEGSLALTGDIFDSTRTKGPTFFRPNQVVRGCVWTLLIGFSRPARR